MNRPFKIKVVFQDYFIYQIKPVLIRSLLNYNQSLQLFCFYCTAVSASLGARLYTQSVIDVESYRHTKAQISQNSLEIFLKY